MSKFNMNPIAILLIINIVMSSGLFSLLFYNSAKVEEARTSAGYAIISQLYKKLDVIHSDTAKQIDRSGNYSAANNQQLAQIIHILNGVENSYANVNRNYQLLVNISHILQQQEQNRTK